MRSSEPLVTVIMATYNRGRHIVPSIRSALGQSLSNFELLVVGDGCTDDTEVCVRSIADPRARWLGLPSRGGSQSFGNNAGLREARSPIVAYLGHDDIWEPDHLANLKEVLDSTGADFAVAGAIYHMPPGCTGHLVTGLFAEDGAQFEHFFPPSSFAHRANVVEKIGFWRPPAVCRAPVDSDFLLRAANAGLTFKSTGKITLHKFAAGHRYLSYVQQDSFEQKETLESLSHPSRAELTELIVREAKSTGAFMIIRHGDYSQYEPGQLAKDNIARKGLDCPQVQPLGMRPITLRQMPGPCALDWSEQVENGYRYHNQNPKPALLLPVTSIVAVRIHVELRHHDPDALSLVEGEINGITFSSRPVPLANGQAQMVFRAKLKPDKSSILRFHLDPRQRGLGVANITIRPILEPGSIYALAKNLLVRRRLASNCD